MLDSLKLTMQVRVDWWQNHLRNHPLAQATIDFETRSACVLKKHGSWIYSKHKSTCVLCLAYKLPGDREPRLWHCAHPEFGIEESKLPEELFAFIAADGLVEAHNAFFERVIWMNVCAARMGWPSVPSDSWRCSASRASACSLPRALEGACLAMNLDVQKDMGSRSLMLKLTKPRKPLKAERLAWAAEGHLDDELELLPMPDLYHGSKEEFEQLWEYCKQDVRAEEALSKALPALSPTELAIWQIDQEFNEAGARFDLEFATIALRLASQWKKRLNNELFEMTGITAATKREAVRKWLTDNEALELPDTTAVTMDEYLSGKHGELTGRAQRVLVIMKQVNRTSTRKYQSMLDKSDPEDQRARDLLMYHGAGTGRWSGKGIQVQNLPRGNVCPNASYFDEKSGKYKLYFDIDIAVADIKTGDIDWLEICYGDVMDLLSGCLRGTVIAKDGHDLMVADYSAIEARCVLWESNALAALEVFRKGGDIYCDMAEGIYGYPVAKDNHPNERQFGKQAILGLGYGMGFITFLLTCRKYKISFELEQVQNILKGKMEKYMGWVKNYFYPERRSGEELKKFQNRQRTAAMNRRKLIDEGEPKDLTSIFHELALMKYTVDVYRSRYSSVKEMWKEQEDAAIKAVREWEVMVENRRLEIKLDWELDNGLEAYKHISFSAMPWESYIGDDIEGPTYLAGKVSWFVRGGFLCCELPSGRLIRYRSPSIKPTKTAWGEVKDALRYMSVGFGGKWVRTATYGGKIVENITQGVARDIMADAMLRSRGYNLGGSNDNLKNVVPLKRGIPTKYFVIMTVHDEMVSEVPEDEGSKPDFEELMSATESWAKGCPITAEALRYKRYRK